jgi:ATP-dependent Clp protease adaptor protein ClpS
MIHMIETQTLVEEVELLIEELIDVEEYELVVFNDEVNTFDHVIKTLIKVCEHTPEQAEQCTMIIHYKGKCTVKYGSRTKLKPMCQAILDAGIQAAIV